jgi:hypothetical protein
MGGSTHHGVSDNAHYDDVIAAFAKQKLNRLRMFIQRASLNFDGSDKAINYTTVIIYCTIFEQF